MADEIDRSSINQEIIESAKLAEIRARAAAIPEGEPGECIECGWIEAPRLVNGVCTFCRDNIERMHAR